MLHSRHLSQNKILFRRETDHFFVLKTLKTLTGSKKVTTISEDETPPTTKKAPNEVPAADKRSHKLKIRNFFRKNPHLEAVKKVIPEKYLALKRVTPPENLYLIDENIAKKATEYILPVIKNCPDQIICETNAGLGLIASELLENDVNLVRLYESCSEFKTYLKGKFEKYTGRVELFTKDIFLLKRYEYIDKQDNGNRVEQLLQGVAKKDWTDKPAMTIIGPLPDMNFIRYLIKSLVLQNFVTSLGRIQLFMFMRPRDFIILSAGPHLNLHTYQRISVFFDLFFDYELLEKFPREMFLPWQSNKSLQTGRYPGQIDTNLMYFVKINFKRDLPVSMDNLLPFYSFVGQFFGRGTKRVIPTLEKWVPGCGLNIMIPTLKHKNYFKNLNIFTQFGELTPQQILSVFEETIHHPAYERSHFMNLIESQLIKTETIESNLDDHLAEKNIDSRIS